MKILKLKPALKDYLWGGNKLKTVYNKESNWDIVAESWELSAHKDGLSTIENGEFKGLTFDKYLEKMGNKVIGNEYTKDRFPILNKIIDANQSLSIQVHPEDKYANEHENDNGKTEMWYIIDAEPGSYLYYGVKEKLAKEEFKESIEEGTLLEKLNKVNVHKGDVFFIEAGTIHAIGEGILIYEVQQSSNVTYRVYDYKRKDKDGNERELHVEKALEVSNLKPNGEYNFDDKNSINSSLKRLAKSDYFDVLKGEVDDWSYTITEESFHAITFLEGNGEILTYGPSYKYEKGDTFFIPANNNEYKISGTGEFILSRLPIE